MAQELINRVEALEDNDRATRQTLKDLTEGQRQLDFKIDEIGADVKDLKVGVRGLKGDVGELKVDVRKVLQHLDKIDRHLGI